MTTREISGHIKEIYGIELSTSFVSGATDAVKQEVVAWQSRPLKQMYPILYMDGIRFSVRDNGKIIDAGMIASQKETPAQLVCRHDTPTSHFLEGNNHA